MNNSASQSSCSIGANEGRRSRANADAAMCDKCIELDKRTAHFKDLAMRIMDPQTLEGARKLIEDLQAQKAALHPEQKK